MNLKNRFVLEKKQNWKSNETCRTARISALDWDELAFTKKKSSGFLRTCDYIICYCLNWIFAKNAITSSSNLFLFLSLPMGHMCVSRNRRKSAKKENTTIACDSIMPICVHCTVLSNLCRWCSTNIWFEKGDDIFRRKIFSSLSYFFFLCQANCLRLL